MRKRTIIRWNRKWMEKNLEETEVQEKGMMEEHKVITEQEGSEVGD